MKSPTIPEVESQFEKEIDSFQQLFQQSFQQQVIGCETPTAIATSARRRSSIFEEILTPEPSVCRWLLDIISENEHMVKESTHFVLSENQLIRIVAYIFDVPESQVQLSIEDEGCCGRFCNDSTQMSNEILIGNINILKLDVEKTEDDALLLLKADKQELIDAYMKTETDALLDEQLNISDQINAYTKQEDDDLLLLKADKSELIDAYNKTEANALLDDKLNVSDQIDTYTKSEDEALLLLKADKSEFADYDNLGTAQTISGQKQFDIITVASVSKWSKNNASIFLAGGGNMLVSSLVNQTELQEVQYIASGKLKAYVFDTQSDLNDQLAVQDNVAKLAIGDNLYIVNKQVVDYWWDGTDLKVLETEQPDMTNVITTLGTAIGGGNAINDLLFSENILIYAKNINFVIADQEQNITGSKTFTSTIRSVGIQVQNFDNLSVVLAGGGVKAI
ncbi:MAG: hypothetical protein EZS28_007059 [Streblomastix strix]|uniref:Uncharacterized protein n=1 Tax=Streblomastix strix TaxID=222440 RepID=A0A5J4WTG2_9EUKA|nr:MAG: hypothetical protein EZS28_007059 [Streblomastix strix]